MPYGIQLSRRWAFFMRPWLVAAIAAGMITGTATATELGVEQDPVSKLLFGELTYTGTSPKLDLALILFSTAVLAGILLVDMLKTEMDGEQWYPPAETVER